MACIFRRIAQESLGLPCYKQAALQHVGVLACMHAPWPPPRM